MTPSPQLSPQKFIKKLGQPVTDSRWIPYFSIMDASNWIGAWVSLKAFLVVGISAMTEFCTAVRGASGKVAQEMAKSKEQHATPAKERKWFPSFFFPINSKIHIHIHNMGEQKISQTIKFIDREPPPARPEPSSKKRPGKRKRKKP